MCGKHPEVVSRVRRSSAAIKRIRLCRVSNGFGIGSRLVAWRRKILLPGEALVRTRPWHHADQSSFSVSPYTAGLGLCMTPRRAFYPRALHTTIVARPVANKINVDVSGTGLKSTVTPVIPVVLPQPRSGTAVVVQTNRDCVKSAPEPDCTYVTVDWDRDIKTGSRSSNVSKTKLISSIVVRGVGRS